jgi:predicted NBD/HSP70 family sugar kinase
MARGVNNESVRAQNLSAVLTHVHRCGRLSRSDLTAATGLNRSTVGVLVTELVERGLLIEGDPVARGTPGRPSPSVQPAERGAAGLAVDVGVATIGLAVGGIGGALEQRTVIDRASERRGPEATADDVAALIMEVTVSLGRPVVGIGVAVPGVVRRGDGLVRTAANLGWRDVPFTDLLTARLGQPCPPVLLGNDAELGATAEHLRGAGAGVDDLLYLLGGIGVGGGIIAGGRPFGGAAGYAGEVGHLVVNPMGQECSCGGRGCLETEVGQAALLRRLGRPVTPEGESRVQLLADAAAGDPEVRTVLAEAGTWLGRAVTSLANVLNPSRVLLAGLFAAAYPHLLDTLQPEVDGQTQWPNRAVMTIAPATLGEEAVLLGAAELALAPLLADPTAADRLPTGGRAS